MSKDLVSYVRSALEKGYSEKAIKKRLVQSGWSEKKVKRAIRKAKGGGSGVLIAVLAVLLIFVIGGGLFVFLPSSGSDDVDTYTPEEFSEPSQDVENETGYPCSEYSTLRLQQVECFKEEIRDAEERFRICDEVPRDAEGSLRMCRKAHTSILEAQNSDSPV